MSKMLGIHYVLGGQWLSLTVLKRLQEAQTLLLLMCSVGTTVDLRTTVKKDLIPSYLVS